MKIYGAGKTWMATRLQWLRDEHNFDIISRWIDHNQVLKDFDDEHDPEVHNNEELKRNIWDNGCLQDCLQCDFMLMLCHPKDGEKHNGSLVELGIVTGNNKPVFILGTCASVEPVGHSDRAWRSQRLVNWMPDIDVMNDDQLLSGARTAQLLYYQNYIKIKHNNDNVVKVG